MSSTIDVIRAGLIAGGVPAYGDMYGLYKTAGAVAADRMLELVDPTKVFTSLATAEAQMASKTLGNATLLITPEAHSLAAALTIDLNLTNFVGLSPGGPAFNKRARIGMSTAFTPMITVSGYGNVFKDLYTMHGTAAGDYIGWLISGARNAFYGDHFGGPMIAAQGGHASYEGVKVTGSENYFKECIFGTNTIGRDEVSPNVTLGAGTITVFEKCIFTCAIDDTDPIFIKVDNTSGYTQAYFLDCIFAVFSANQANKMAVAFDFAAADFSADMYLSPGCTFQGVTKLAASAEMKHIWCPTVFAATADELNLIAINSATY